MDIRKIKGKTFAGLIVGAILAIALGAGIMHMISEMKFVTTEDAYVKGRVHQIAFKVPGSVARVMVTDNQAVKKGDVLVEIDPADYQVKVREAEAALAAEEARLKDAETREVSSRTALEIQETMLRQAGLDKKRAERLFAEGALPKEKLEKAGTAYDLAVSQAKAAKEGIAQAEAYKTLESAMVDQRKAVLATARLGLGYTKVVSPADGVVTRKSVEEGNQVLPGLPLMAIVATDDIWVEANFKETQLAAVRPGQDVVLHVDTYRGVEFSGKVESIMAGTGAVFSLFPAENALGNYVKVVQRVPVRIKLSEGQDPEHLLRVGMSVITKVKVK